MKMTSLHRRVFFLTLLFLAPLGSGFDRELGAISPHSDPKADRPAVRKLELGKNLFLEIQGDRRRVLVHGSICLRAGLLELLLTRKDTKEHEAVISSELDARKLHEALLLANATAGSPVKFQPKYQAASGTTIKITVQYQEKGKDREIDAREWVRESRSKQTLNQHWVFAGSRLIPNPLDPKKLIYLANDGDLVCVSNFETALLDIPLKSTKDNAELVWEANTDKIPPVGTKVVVIFEPVIEKKK